MGMILTQPLHEPRPLSRLSSFGDTRRKAAIVLSGDVIELRLVRETDLERLYDLLSNLNTRGAYFPLGVMSETTLRAEFNKSSFWDREEGMLHMVDETGEVVREMEYFPIARYLQGCEISYQVFRAERAGKGYTSEAPFPKPPHFPGRGIEPSPA